MNPSTMTYVTAGLTGLFAVFLFVGGKAALGMLALIVAVQWMHIALLQEKYRSLSEHVSTMFDFQNQYNVTQNDVLEAQGKVITRYNDLTNALDEVLKRD